VGVVGSGGSSRNGVSGMSELGHLVVQHPAMALSLSRGVEWELLDNAGRAEMVSAARSELGHLGAEAHANAFSPTRGVEWELFDKAVRAEMVSATMCEHRGAASRLGTAKKRTEGIEACAQKIAHSEGKNWGSLWTLTQESYRDEAETVCQNCHVGGSAPQSQIDAFHNLLTGIVRHWMGEDYFGDCMVARKHGANRPDLDGFKHNQQPLLDRVIQKCSMTTTKLRLSKIVTPFPVFKEHLEPNAVITMADDQGGTLDVKLLELLCFTSKRHKAKVARALKMENDGLA